jgi:hypothetical protein
MAVSLITTLTIQNPENDIRCEAVQSAHTKLWSGEANLYKQNCLHATLLSSDYSYQSADEAKIAIQGAVDLIRSIHLVEEEV